AVFEHQTDGVLGHREGFVLILAVGHDLGQRGDPNGESASLFSLEHHGEGAALVHLRPVRWFSVSIHSTKAAVVSVLHRQPPPPPTSKWPPVRQLHASEHMNRTSSPISSGWPKRFIGTSSRKRLRISGEVCAASWNGVRIGPGEIERQRMPCVANSRAT